MEISGSATADSDIALYVDGEPAKLIDLAKSTDTDRVYLDGSTVKTNKAGQYTAAAELYGGRSPAEIDPGEISEIYAVDGVRQTNSVFVRYAPGMPNVAALGDIKHKALLISLPWEEMTYLEPPPPGSAGGGGGGGTMAPTLLLSSTGDTIFEKFGVARASLVSVYVSGDNPNALGERLKDRTGWQWTQTVPVILRYDPGEDLEYRVIFDKNDDDISKVWVNIENAAGGNEYIMPAEYDSAKGYWLATGELPSVGFVPGLISVDYILKLGTDISLEEEALSALQNRPALNDPELLTALVNNELRTYTMPEGLLDDDNLADKMWRQLVEAVPDLAAISVTENPDETETVSYTTADGEESVTGKMWALDKTDPAVIALAEEMLEAESALPLGSNGWYTISAIVHYTQGGQEKTMPYENFLMLLSDYDSNADAMAALDIADSVKVAYTEMIRLPQAAAPQARSARLLPGSDQATPEGFDAYCTALDFSLSGLDLGKEALGITDDMLDVNIGGGKALNGANLLSAIGAALGLKDIVNNVNENCDIKYLFKQYNDLGNSLQSLSNTECFKSMSYEDVRAFYRIMDDYYKAYSKYNRWQRNNRMFNNGKVIFTSGAIIFSAMTMGAGGEGYVLTKLGEGVSRGITASGVALSAGDIAYGYLGSKEFTKLMISAHINNLNRFEAAFTRYMYKKCGRLNRTVTDPYRVKVVFDPSGFAYENGDLNQKVAGVLAEIWQADDAGGANARLWTEAAEYGEVNPQITGEDGWYAWDVPVGWWQVRLSKDGYQEARSEWLPVLPVQLGVNLELIPAGGDPGDGDGGGGGGGGGGAAAPPPPVSPETPWNNPFADVSAGDWFYGDVEYVYTKGLMNGTGADQFSPRLALTRGMIVTILHRLAGAPDVAGSADPFGDVASGQYYADAVKWAAANGIVSGVGGGKFAPDAAITRQDLAVVLNRYTGFAGMNLPAQRPYAAFNDSAAIADYAKAAVETFYSAGIINGVPGGLFNPKSGATRAEVAAMLHRFLETAGEQ
jgi:hypothetical protein